MSRQFSEGSRPLGSMLKRTTPSTSTLSKRPSAGHLDWKPQTRSSLTLQLHRLLQPDIQRPGLYPEAVASVDQPMKMKMSTRARLALRLARGLERYLRGPVSCTRSHALFLFYLNETKSGSLSSFLVIRIYPYPYYYFSGQVFPHHRKPIKSICFPDVHEALFFFVHSIPFSSFNPFIHI